MKLVLGSAQFGMDYGISNELGKVNEKEVRKILSLASLNGIYEVDTAINYGTSQSILGRQNKKFSFSTKLPNFCLDSHSIKNKVHEYLENSYSELSTNKIDILYLHSSYQLLENNGERLHAVLEELKFNKKIKRIGISVYDLDKTLEIISKFDIDVIQAPINIFDRRFLDKNFILEIRKKNINLYARSIFLQGLLLMPFNKVPNYFHKWKDIFVNWNSWLTENNLTPLQACISYVMNIDDINNFIVGVNSVDQFKEIIQCYRASEKINNFKHEYLNISNLIDPTLWKIH